jgi:Arc/MetJ-type ribon-helix-helix transcriptional regulator
MEGRKISVSLSEPDLDFIDRYTAEHEVASRSATVQRAIALLRANELSDAYVEAWQEWSEQDEAAWEPTAADGLDHHADATR